MADPLPTYYDVLQVELDTPPDGIRRAYRQLAQKYHPDQMPDNANAARAMAAINAAYEVLSDSGRRAEHDLWIRRAQRPAAVVAAAPLPRTVWEYLHPRTKWPWYLLAATSIAASGTVATAMYLSSMPARFGAAAAAASEQPGCVARASGTGPRCARH